MQCLNEGARKAGWKIAFCNCPQCNPSKPGYRVSAGAVNMEYESFAALKIAFGSASNYKVLYNGDVVITHPLNPKKPLKAIKL